MLGVTSLSLFTSGRDLSVESWTEVSECGPWTATRRPAEFVDEEQLGPFDVVTSVTTFSVWVKRSTFNWFHGPARQGLELFGGL